MSTVHDFTSVPPGVYLCEVAEVRTGKTRAGEERWSLHLKVADGEHAGRLAAWDALVFSARGLARVRRVFKALGFPKEGKVRVESQDLVGARALVRIEQAEYDGHGEHGERGVRVRRNEVPYDGYSAP